MSDPASSTVVPSNASWPMPWPRPRGVRPKAFRQTTKLPDELLIIIGEYIRVPDLARFSQTSQRFYQIMKDILWRKARDHLFWYPMFYGACTGNIPTMEEALRRGCPIDKPWLCIKLGAKQRFKKDQSPLHIAVSNMQADAVDWLLAHGARVDIRYPHQFDDDLHLFRLATGWAKHNHVSLCMSTIPAKSLAEQWQAPTGPRYRILAALLDAGVRPRDERQAIRYAAYCCRIISVPIVQQLLLHGSDINTLCTCRLHTNFFVDRDVDDVAKSWIWRCRCPRTRRDPNIWGIRVARGCFHDEFDFMPWPQSVQQTFVETMCPALASLDANSRRFLPDAEASNP